MPIPTPKRRVFLMQLSTSAGLLAVAHPLRAQTRVDEADESAVALGYRHDTRQVDAKKYPAHQPEQKCVNCQFWQGAATDAWAGCSMFGRKQVANAGWCVAWKKP